MSIPKNSLRQPLGPREGAEYLKALDEQQYFDAQQIVNKQYGVETVSSDIDRQGAHSPPTHSLAFLRVI